MCVKSLFTAAAALVLGISILGTAAQAREVGESTAIEAVVPTDFRTTWNALLSELDEGDFTINATIKEKSTIRVLLQSKVPSPWVDCGSVSVDSKHKTFGDRNYKFLAANSVRYLVADDEFNELIDVERRTSLNALATIKLTPVGQATRVSVDAHYVMKFRTREFGRKVTPRFLDDSLDFDSAGEAAVSEEIREGSKMKVVSIQCRPTGALERQIVSVLERPQLMTVANTDPRRPAEPQTAEQPVKVTAPQKSLVRTAVVAPRLWKPLSPAKPSARKRVDPSALIKVATRPSPPSKVLFPEKLPPALAAGAAWRIQLSALRSKSDAEKAWHKLQRANPDLLSVLTLRVQKVELSKGTFFRAQAGPLADQPTSASLCNTLKKRKQACLVVSP
ncbi:MAG: hypothetical protein GKS02_00225 [Alphaproteobacteria bacterium]|nr:hypothetical protein [Alphaproteobacteria bacterium]